MISNIFENPKKKVYCLFCEREITKRTQVVCRECDHTVLCLVCFGKRIENSQHKSVHKYSINQKMNLSLRDKNWTASQELILIEGLEKYGYGNWDDISHHIGTKTSEDTESHFYKFFNFQTRHQLLKSNNLSLKSQKPKSTDTSQQKSQDSENEPQSENNQTSKTMNNLYQYSPDSNSDNIIRLNHSDPIKIRNLHLFSEIDTTFNCEFKTLHQRKIEDLKDSLETVNRENESKNKNPNYFKNAFALGFMDNRHEFDVEFNNEAEIYLAELDFRGDETPEENAIKESVLELYMAKIEEREKRKQFVIEHDILNFDETKSSLKHLKPEEKIFSSLLKRSASLLSKTGYEDLTSTFGNILKMGRLKQKHLISKRNDKKKGNQKRLSDKFKSSEQSKSNGSSNSNSRRLSELDQANKDELSSHFVNIFKLEMTLCEDHFIDFDVYLMIKEYLIRKSCCLGSLSKSTMIKESFFDKNTFSTVFDFVKEHKIIVVDESEA